VNEQEIIATTIEFMKRVQLQGAEVPAFQICMNRLFAQAKPQAVEEPEEKPAKPAKG
jgi:hypothetical protein